MWWDKMDVQRVRKKEGKIDGRFWQLGLALAVIRGGGGRRGSRIRRWETSPEKSREHKALWRSEGRSSGMKKKKTFLCSNRPQKSAFKLRKPTTPLQKNFIRSLAAGPWPFAAPPLQWSWPSWTLKRLAGCGFPQSNCSTANKFVSWPEIL